MVWGCIVIKNAPAEIAEAIRLWFSTELSDFVSRRLRINFLHDGISLYTDSAFTKYRQGRIIMMESKLFFTCNDLDIYKSVEYCNPKMFEEIHLLVMQFYNGIKGLKDDQNTG